MRCRLRLMQGVSDLVFSAFCAAPVLVDLFRDFSSFDGLSFGGSRVRCDGWQQLDSLSRMTDGGS